MLDSPLVQPLLTFAASVAGTLFAGFLGYWFGIARLRRERGFDRRLEWHKDMLEALHRVAKWIDSVGETEGEARLALATDPARHVNVERFDVLVAEARAYASPSAVAALNRIAHSFDRMNAEPDPETTEHQQVFLARQLELMRVASEELSDEMRRHLGLEPLNDSSWPFSVPLLKQGDSLGAS